MEYLVSCNVLKLVARTRWKRPVGQVRTSSLSHSFEKGRFAEALNQKKTDLPIMN